MTEQRGVWGSKIGFVLAAAGSAIGLGNIWRFPYVTGENGGAAFVILYVFLVLIIGAPVMVAELTIGRRTQRNPVGAFRLLSKNRLWSWVGVLGVLTGIGILSYYSVVAGWTLGYFIKSISGTFTGDFSATESVKVFTSFVQNPAVAIGLLFCFVCLTGLVVMGGISHGIERWAKILMPLLFILLLLLTLRSVTLPGATKGLSFYLKPDFSEMTIGTFGSALGQALFSLSLGMGTMLTYGSYIAKRENLTISAGYVCLFDTMIAIISGLMIFPALFAMNMAPEQGPKLVFVVLPTIFSQMPGGAFFGAGFFLLLTVAALTSTISLLEVPVSFIVDEFKWSRKKAVLLAVSFAFVVGIPSALSQGASSWFSHLPVIGMGFLDFANILLGNYSLTFGALLIALFVAYRWGIKEVVAEITLGGNRFYFQKTWGFLIRYLCPIAILLIFVYILVTGNYF